MQNRFMEVGPLTLAALTAGLLLASGNCYAQSTRVEDLAQGKIIITPRDAPDPHFSNSVIVLARYGRTGALGLMLHYKSDLTVQQALKGFKGAEKRTDPVFVGGPVELPAILALLRSKSPAASGDHVTGDLYLLVSRPGIEVALTDGGAASDLRLYIGYSGWGPGQLESEVRRHGWFIFDYDEDTVFDKHPDTIWNRLIAKTERRLALLPDWRTRFTASLRLP